MFGYVNVNKSTLSQENTDKYKSFYCGLCHVLGDKYGLFSRITLTYDMTFMALFFASFYDEKITYSEKRCFVHPFKKHMAASCDALEYAAAMNVALAYHNCLDDWHDDKNVLKGIEAFLIKRHYKKIKKLYPQQCASIEKCIKDLSETEKKGILDPDLAANSFAELMGELFVYKNDENKELICSFAHDLGKFIYIMDAACDIKTDLRKEKYNPLVMVDKKSICDILNMLSNSYIKKFEELECVKDDELLQNILYSGIWIRFTQIFYGKDKKGDETHAG